LCRDAIREAPGNAELAITTARLLSEFGRRVEAYEILKGYEVASKGGPVDDRLKETLSVLKKSK
jgi:hypothetical protein